MKLIRIFTILTLTVFCLALPSSGSQNFDLLLSGSDIDLLVGTPTGVKEPLDSRRTVYAPDPSNDFSGFLEDELSNDVTFGDLDWSDAEEAPACDDQTEAQMLDLLSETDELENTELPDSNEDIDEENAFSSENVETDLKL